MLNRSAIRCRLLCAVIVSILPGCIAGADAPSDTVTFHNGDRLTGRLKIATPRAVTFTGAVTGDLTLDWKDIQELSLASGDMSIVSAAHPEGEVVSRPVIAVADNRLQVRTAAESLPDIALADLVSLASPNPSDPPSGQSKKHFKAVGGVLKLSPESIVRATQRQISLAGAFDLGVVTSSEDAFAHQSTSLATEANYTDARKIGGAPVFTELYSGNLQQNVYLRHTSDTAKFSRDGPYAYALANAWHNLSLGMNIAQSYGGGLGWDGGYGDSSFSFAADLRYLNESLYSPGKPVTGAAAGISESYSYVFLPHAISIGERIVFLPVLRNSGAYVVRGSATLDIPISAALALDFSLLDDYLENAPPKTLRNYAKYTFNLKYTIGGPPKSH